MQPDKQIALTKQGLCSPLKSTYEDDEVMQIPYAEALKKSLEQGAYFFEAGPECDVVM